MTLAMSSALAEFETKVPTLLATSLLRIIDQPLILLILLCIVKQHVLYLFE